MNTGLQRRRLRRWRGVSTVIATLFLILILISMITILYMTTQRMGRTVEVINKAVERRSEESKLVLEEKSATIEPEGIFLTLENKGSRTALLVTYYVREKGESQAKTGNLSAVIPAGQTSIVRIPGAYDPGREYIIVLVDKLGGVYRFTYPYTPTTTQPGGVGYQLEYMPFIAGNYTVAARGYKPSSPYNVEYNGYKVFAGNTLSTSPLSIEAENITLYRFPEYVGWAYYKEINITERTGSNLQDYTVPIILNSSNFDFNKAKDDGSDIRFLASDGRMLLDYWIQYWNKDNQEALVWVKLNLTGGVATTIYMLYGNPEASYDPDHYGLPKVAAQLPADDGSNYKIQYMIWDTGENLFDPNQGTPQGWHGDDSTWSLSLGFSFPYYNSAYSSVHVCSNGFIGTTYSGTDYTSTINELESRGMIAVFWADLMTNVGGSDKDIYVNSSYVDNVLGLGQGVLIRWNTVFYYDRGNQNFDVILYRNGLIRMDYGDIYGRSSTDGTPVIGVSLGDGDHYTLVTPNNNARASDWSYHSSIVLWPRKNASVEPVVSIDNTDRENRYVGYGVNVSFYWDMASNVLVRSFISDFDLSDSGDGFTYFLYYNESDSLVYLDSSSVGLGYNEVNSSVMRLASGKIYFNVVVIHDSPFNITFTDVELEVSRLSNPVIGVAVNSSSRFYIYDLVNGGWSSYTLPGGVVFSSPALGFDPGGFRFIIASANSLVAFYMSNESFSTIASLPESSGDSGFVAVLGGYILYAPGGGSSSLYLYDRGGSLLGQYSMPEDVDPYTCIAVDYSRGVMYVLFGGTGDLYAVNVSGGTPSFTELNVDPAPPTVYPVGMDYGDGYLWVIGRGGGLHRIDVVTGSVGAVVSQAPYYPMGSGDRLVYWTGKLYHVREDGTSELWVFNTG